MISCSREGIPSSVRPVLIARLIARLIAILLCSAFAWAQPLSYEDAAALIEKSRTKALDYTRSLPDFVCTEIVRRDADPSPGQRGRPMPTEKLTVKLSYSQHKEEHKLLLVNDKPTDRTFENLGGALGTGEFGSTLGAIFDAASKTSFRWERWKNVRKRRAAVYAYVLDVAQSHFLLVTTVSNTLQQAIVGYHGVLEIDSETGEVLHFTYQADNIPAHLQLQYAITTVDYDFADVGGRNYLLPAHSQTVMRDPHWTVRNEMEFRDYRKFSTDSVIDFGSGK
jgi:hypothetical protein